MTSLSYKKLFICDLLKNVNSHHLNAETSKVLVKAQIMGFISGIQKFAQRTVFCVDDGTGILNCTLWYNEPASLDKTLELKKVLQLGSIGLANEFKGCALSLLNKAEDASTVDLDEYSHGDIIFCLGNVKLYKGKPKLDIVHHFKQSDVNAETHWILDILMSRQKEGK